MKRDIPPFKGRKSLRSRIVIGLSLVILLFWFIVFAGCLWVFNDQTHPPWDPSLRALADRILISTQIRIPLPSDFPSDSQDKGLIMEEPEGLDAASIQVWSDRRLILRSSQAPLLPLKPDFMIGFADKSIDSTTWRVYDTSDPTGRTHVQVGKSPQHRLDVFTHFAIFWVVATALLLALPTFATWVVIRWSFRPVDAMRSMINDRQPFDLTPLPHETIPTEVRSLVDSFNLMLTQVDAAVQTERRFIADAAHELRTPLAVLAALAQVALRADSMDEKNEVLRRLSAGVERSARLSEQMLDLARLQAGALVADHQPVELSEVVTLLVRDAETTAYANKQSITLTTEPAWTNGNLDELGILTRNLIDNALRYSGSGSHIRVFCHDDVHDMLPCVTLTVEDNGPGVPREEYERIFDRFFRIAGTVNTGSGIGLSLVAAIAKAHAALIEVADRAGNQGFRISVFFPRCDPTLK